MHPDTYLFLAGERIADLQRDADRRRRTPRVVPGRRATIHHRQAVAAVGVACTPMSGERGAG
jgi:hypothetical protein